MIFSGMVKNSLVDYPGLICCVLFVPGCHYNCFYCHNRVLLGGTYELLKINDIVEFLKKRVGLLDAVVISGGEPTLQAGLTDSIKLFKSLGYKVKLDTNGSSPHVVEGLLQNGLCDYYAIDYKAPAARYREICGKNADADTALETIGLLQKVKADFEVRTTVIPQLLEQDLMTMATELPLLPRYVLNRYRVPENYLPADEERILAKPYTQAQLDAFAVRLRPFQPNTVT